jgi:hypothetical protein
MLPVLLFSRVRISNSYGTARTTKIANQQWQLPPTQRTSPIQPSSSWLPFAVGFISITYWNILQKEVSYLLGPLIKKVGSRQKAGKALFAVCDDTMLDRWIPDEDGVRQIQDNGKNDCSIWNLDSGMPAQCVWQNNLWRWVSCCPAKQDFGLNRCRQRIHSKEELVEFF